MTLLHNRRTILIGGATVAAAFTGVGAYLWRDRSHGEPEQRAGTVGVVPGAETKYEFPILAPIAESDAPIETPDPEVESRLHRLLEEDVANSYRRSLERRQGVAVTQTQTPSDMPAILAESAPPAWVP